MSVYESTAPRGGGVAVAAVCVALVTAVGVFTRPLMAIDETRYAAVALEMLQRNDWLVPHLNGATYSHKPPLLFWLVLAGWKVFGISELWARLVAPICGVVALGLIAMLARALWPHDARTRGWAPLITAGALLWASFGTLFMFDTLLASCALLALIGVVQAVERNRARGVAMIALGLALGLLAKGPVILLHVAPAALLAPWWATPTPSRRWSVWYASFVSAVLLGAGGALLWAWPAGLAGGEAYQQAILFGQTTGRMTQSFAHRRDIWWYLPILPAALFPWFVWPEGWRALGALRLAPRDAGVRFCLVWCVAGVLAFSLVSGKQAHYLLPLVPAGAMLLARGLSLREAAPLARPWLPALGLVLLSGLVIVAGTTTLLSRTLWWPHEPLHWWWALLPFAAAITLLVWQRGHSTRNAAVHTLAASTTLLLCGLQLAAARAATVPYDTAPMASIVRRELAAGHRIAMIGAYNGEYHFQGRLRDARIEMIAAADAPQWLQSHRGGLLLRYDRGRVAPPIAGVVAQHPFRNGWATLSTGVRRDVAISDARATSH
jgi:4-amino-4-deoxy-L-arabinose transferase-like glycosyltransferase